MLSPSERRAAYPQALSSQQAQRLQSTMLRNKYELYIISLYEMSILNNKINYFYYYLNLIDKC